MIDNKQKPLSPHLTIYRPQVSSVLSILHRIASILSLFGMLIAIAWLGFIVYAPYQDQSAVWQMFQHTYVKVVLVLWSYAFVYYICTEIRYLFWGFGLGFKIKQINRSGFMAVLASLIIWGGFWFLVFNHGK